MNRSGDRYVSGGAGRRTHTYLPQCAAADSAGTFVYADTTGNAFTFSAGATSFGAGSGSRGSLDDLKIVPGRAAMLAANTVSTETVN